MAGWELPNCSKCPANPALREAWGCDRPAQAAVAVIPGEGGGSCEYRQCPSKFIPASVHDFMRRLAYLREFPHTAKAFDERGKRWEAFEGYHNDTVARFQDMMKWGK